MPAPDARGRRSGEPVNTPAAVRRPPESTALTPRMLGVDESGALLGVPAHRGSWTHFSEWRIEVEHALGGVEPAGCLHTAGNGTGIDLPSRPLTTVAGYT